MPSVGGDTMRSPMIEPVVFDGAQYALILRGRELLAQPMNSSDVSFLTSSEANLQLGYMRHPVGKVIDAHIHTDVEHGGHGFSVLDEAVFLVVKQGPHVGAADKIRFQRANAA